MNNTMVTGFALFAMFFGAGNLIFSPMLGRSVGPEYLRSMLGFIAAGVGLPFLGVLAVARVRGGIEDIAKPLGGVASKIVTVIVMLCIGPLLSVPRTCATTYEISIVPYFPWLSSWMFSLLYFLVVLGFVMNPLSVVDRIGKILTPALFISIIVLIVAGVLFPLGSRTVSSVADPFGESFSQGYQTMDLMAATIFGIVLINDMKGKGVVCGKKQFLLMVKAGLIAAVGLSVIYAGLIYLGSISGSISGNMSHTELLCAISNRVLGRAGGMLLGVATFLACLTTAIGLLAVCGQYFEKILKGKIKYRIICVLCAGASLILANAGVEMIIKLAMPVLMTIYPAIVVMVVLAIIGERVRSIFIWIPSIIGALLVGVINSFYLEGVRSGLHVFDHLPFAKQGLDWILPALLFGFAGAIVRFVYYKYKKPL